jgi:hypothetical protein
MCELVLNVSRVVAELVRCEDVGKMCFRGAQLVGVSNPKCCVVRVYRGADVSL